MIKLIMNDFRINSFRSALIIMFYRILNRLHRFERNFIILILLKVSSIIWELLKILLNINCQISYKANIGENFRLLHIGEGVIISSKANIGSNVTIYHQVTIGINEFLPFDKQPIYIGDNCYISTGAKIISCRLGQFVKVGPNAVVYKDINDYGKVFSDNTIHNSGYIPILEPHTKMAEQ